MAIIEWYDPEAGSVRRVRFSGEQPAQVSAQIARAARYEALRGEGKTHATAVAQLDAEAEALRPGEAPS